LNFVTTTNFINLRLLENIYSNPLPKFVDSINGSDTDTGRGQTDGGSGHTMCLYNYSKRTSMPAKYSYVLNLSVRNLHAWRPLLRSGYAACLTRSMQLISTAVTRGCPKL